MAPFKAVLNGASAFGDEASVHQQADAAHNTTASATSSAFSLTPLRSPVLSIIASNVSTATPNKLVVSGVATGDHTFPSSLNKHRRRLVLELWRSYLLAMEERTENLRVTAKSPIDWPGAQREALPAKVAMEG
ncbi:hypothetical protein MUK42_23755 [Musa troglodytarum]|uniref:Uncharacterized protein n=1 Tax=Musa troglodytarum TaxID=320322 RepID=A0A9E7JIZ9_9LILI|nr:hypothetical protein MUK42_23755 [Musa troglodytarum]